MPDSNHTSENELLTACAFVSKGGVGKTTSIAHLGVALANDGYDVLLIDLAGKQGDLAKSFGIYDGLDDDAWPNISTVFKPEWENVVQAIGEENVLRAPPGADFDSLVAGTDEGVDLIPAHEGLDSLDIELNNNYDGVERYTQLDSFLAEHVAPHYTVCLLDLPGAPNSISYSGVFAARHVITPVQTGSFESKQVDSLEHDLRTIRENYDRSVGLSLLLPTMVDRRTKLSREYIKDYGERYADALAPKPVPRSQDIVNAQDIGKTVFALEEPSRTAQRAREAYEMNAEELVHRIAEIRYA